MNIFGLGSQSTNPLLSFLSGLVQGVESGSTTQTNTTAQTANVIGANNDTDSSSTSPVAATTDLSQPAQLFNELAQLQTSDPAKFKQVMSEMAASISQMAQSQGGAAAQALNQVAQEFENASTTGSLSAFETSNVTGQPANTYNATGQPVATSQAATQATSGSALIQALSTSGGHHHHGHGGGGSQMQSDLTSIFSQLSQDISGQEPATTASAATST